MRARGRSLYQSDPDKIKAVARTSYHAEKKAAVRAFYCADPDKKKAAVRYGPYMLLTQIRRRLLLGPHMLRILIRKRQLLGPYSYMLNPLNNILLIGLRIEIMLTDDGLLQKPVMMQTLD